MTRPRIPEKSVLRDCLAALELYPQIKAWRQNTGAVKTETGRFLRFSTPGAADLTGIWLSSELCGVRLEIECKASDGRQSPAQVAFQSLIESYGGIYLLVRSAEDMMEQLAELGIKPGRGRD